ncbi:hypothetical protein DK847_01490 [Aestuariivirga litoralis]|uniref:Inosine/uridine-preferring nucleoside hydrolase domain-containing protein n=2 Tax=Aestuariivirga litoralis TaxID=2650924 RepID=A0A2W2AXM9_9HYPH|nr:hypothetical protein DK847_01490 [Aestuariivirga litoralis]
MDTTADTGKMRRVVTDLGNKGEFAMIRSVGRTVPALLMLAAVTIAPPQVRGADIPSEPGSAAASPAAASALKPAACTLIDTDFDIDDMMAIPLVIGSSYVAAIITSEGYTLPADGAGALARLIAEPGQRQIPVIIGASSHLPDSTIRADWGQFVLDYRDMMGNAFALLSADLPPAAQSATDYVIEVAQAVAECDSIDILVIGTFTSFIHYSPAIRPRIKNVVIMGMPLRGDPTQRPGNFSFNCEYDMTACETAFDRQLPGLSHFFVDPPRSSFDTDPVGHQDTVYGPTLAMVQGLAPQGLPNALRQALTGTVRDGSLGPAVKGADYWAIDCCFRAGGKSLLWDQSAALFLAHPDAFHRVGGHYEPNVTAEALRALWTRATNASVNYVEEPRSP